MQAIGTTALDLPPKPGEHACFGRDHEYVRRGTVSILAGIDLLTGKVHALVKDRHRSREFIEFLELLDKAYQTDTAIKVMLDNHSAQISKETKAWLPQQPAGRFQFTFTPKHGSWLNLIEGFFSKLTCSVLRHIRVASKTELKDRIMAAIDDVNLNPVIHCWTYYLDAARYDSNLGNDVLGHRFGVGTLWRFSERHGATYKNDHARQRTGTAGHLEAARRLVTWATRPRFRTPRLLRRDLGFRQYGARTVDVRGRSAPASEDEELHRWTARDRHVRAFAFDRPVSGKQPEGAARSTISSRDQNAC